MGRKGLPCDIPRWGLTTSTTSISPISSFRWMIRPAPAPSKPWILVESVMVLDLVVFFSNGLTSL